MVFHDVESLFSVAGCENFIIIVEATFEEMTRVKVVFDYKDGCTTILLTGLLGIFALVHQSLLRPFLLNHQSFIFYLLLFVYRYGNNED